jgi:hypothetical protein
MLLCEEGLKCECYSAVVLFTLSPRNVKAVYSARFSAVCWTAYQWHCVCLCPFIGPVNELGDGFHAVTMLAIGDQPNP